MKQPTITQKLILHAEDKVLIMKHQDGTMDFPGGRIEWGEDLFGALQRELREEANFQLEHEPRLFHIYNYISQDKSKHAVMIYYVTEIPHIITLTSPEGMELLWLTRDEMYEYVKHKDFVDKIFDWRDRGGNYSINYA